MKKFLVLSAALLSALSATRAYADPEPEGYGLEPTSIVLYSNTSTESNTPTSFSDAQGVGSAGQVGAIAAPRSIYRGGAIGGFSHSEAWVDNYLSETYVHTGNPGTYTSVFVCALGQGLAQGSNFGDGQGATVQVAAYGLADGYGYYNAYGYAGAPNDGESSASFQTGEVHELVGAYQPVIHVEGGSYLYANAESHGPDMNDAAGQAISEFYPFAQYGTPPEGFNGEGQ